jgi:uncharacterized protein (DUF952 family)
MEAPSDLHVFKIFLPEAWAEASAARSFAGSEFDASSGFIHLCSAKQLPGTLQRFFKEQATVVAKLRVAALSSNDLRWDPVEAMSGELFPHAYSGPLSLDEEAVAATECIAAGAEPSEAFLAVSDEASAE